jgi:tRNA(fMet)-specific endonuclease VapC
MSFLLHRDTCAAFLRQVRRVVNRMTQHGGQLHVSALTIMGLELWLVRHQTPAKYLQGYRAFTQSITVLGVDEAIAHRAAGVGSRLRLQGQRVTDLNLLIAGTALTQGLTLVTHATQVFAAIPGLQVVDWTRP